MYEHQRARHTEHSLTYDTAQILKISSYKMESTDGAAHLSYPHLKKHLRSYESHVPPNLQDLESLRLNDIPEALAQRKKNGESLLEKKEVTSLVEWKLWVTFIIHIYRKPQR